MTLEKINSCKGFAVSLIRKKGVFTVFITSDAGLLKYVSSEIKKFTQKKSRFWKMFALKKTKKR